MLVRKHGYDPEREIQEVISLDITYNDGLQLVWIDKNYNKHTDNIQEIQREIAPNKLIFYTSENW